MTMCLMLCWVTSAHSLLAPPPPQANADVAAHWSDLFNIEVPQDLWVAIQAQQEACAHILESKDTLIKASGVPVHVQSHLRARPITCMHAPSPALRACPSHAGDEAGGEAEGRRVHAPAEAARHGH